MGGDVWRTRRRLAPALSACIATLLIPAFMSAFPRPAFAERLPIRVYTIADGLPHDRINRIMRDSRGFLWFCTPGGLGRFDGGSFVTYHEADGLPSESVNDILEDGDVYWIATNGGGVARFDPYAASVTGQTVTSRFTIFPVGGQPASNRVNVLYKDVASRIWAATDGGLFIFEPASRGGRFQQVSLGVPGYAENALQVWSIQQNPDAVIWIGTSRGLVRRLPSGATEWYAVRPAGGVDHVWTVLRARDGRMLIGHSAGLLVIDARRAHTPQIGVRAHPRIDDLGPSRWYTATNSRSHAREGALRNARRSCVDR